MAKMFPSSLDGLKVQKGEETIYNILRDKLNDDYIVIFDTELKAIKCKFHGGKYYNPDFVIISNFGVLVVEIKDWNPYWIKEYNHDNNVITINNKKEINPFSQAKAYSNFIANTLKESEEFKNIKWDRVVVFPTFKREELLKKVAEQRYIIEAENNQKLSTNYLFKDDIDELQEEKSNESSPEEISKKLVQVLKNCFQYKYEKNQCLTQKQREDIKSFLLNRVVFDRSFEEVIKALDTNQKDIVKDLDNSQILINGVAGSGKTIALMAKATLFAKENQDQEILFLTFNTDLKDYIEAMLKDTDNIEVASKCKFLRDLANSYNIDYQCFLEEKDKIKQNEKLNELRKHIKKNYPDKDKYKGIFIDEGQDFTEHELLVIKELLINPELSHFVIASDGLQNIYDNIYSFKGLVSKTFTMSKNYRNTKKIFNFISNSCNLNNVQKDQDGYMSNCDYYYENANILNHAGDDLVFEHLCKKDIIPYIKEKLDKLGIKDDYTVLCPMNYMVGDIKDLNKNHRDQMINNKNIATIHKKKGLDFKAVFVINHCSINLDEEKRKLLKFTAYTRAREYLFVLNIKEKLQSNQLQRLDLFVGKELL